jgi:hypothetical protein
MGVDVDRLDALAANQDGEAHRRLLLGARRIKEPATAEGDARAGGLEEASPVDHFSPLNFLDGASSRTARLDRAQA